MKTIQSRLMLSLFCLLPVSSMAAVTSCESLTGAQRQKCEFVKAKKESFVPTGVIPVQCQSIEDDRATNRSSTYQSRLAECTRTVTNDTATSSLNDATIPVVRGEGSTSIGVNNIPTQAYGSCHWMQAHGMSPSESCAQDTPGPIKMTIPYRQDGPGAFLLAPGEYKPPMVYYVYASSYETNGIVQNVSIYDNESTGRALYGLTLLDDKVASLDASNEITNNLPNGTGGYAGAFLVSKPIGSTVTGPVFQASSVNNAKPDVNKPSGQDVLSNYAAMGNPENYGVIGFSLDYKNTYRKDITGFATITDTGTFACGGTPPAATPPSHEGIKPDQPVGAEYCGKYGPTDYPGTQVSLVITPVMSGGACVYNEFTRVTRYNYRVTFPCKSFVVNLVNVF